MTSGLEERFQTLHEIVETARRNLAPGAWDYLVALRWGPPRSDSAGSPAWAVAAAGQAGLVRVLELLEDEIRICLGLLGVTRLAELSPSYLSPADPVTPPSVTSAFPLLDLDTNRY